MRIHTKDRVTSIIPYLIPVSNSFAIAFSLDFPSVQRKILTLTHVRSCRNSSIESTTWTPKVYKIMALMAIIMGLGLLFYILWGV